jgi:lipopolysaccharide/colanic/teichoic acid biosynthesis glycosyltransferase
LFPVWLALFLGIYCALYFPNRGQVLFTQPRVGKSGRRFAVFKFRTLRSGVVHPLVKPIQPDPGQHLFLGGWLRKTGLDELPQFLNILKGDMHVVGPRPFVRRDLAHLSSEESRQRHIVRPGLTGLWQVTRRYDESDIDFLDVDREYIRSASLWLDLCIICRTVRYVLKLRGR